MERVVVLVEEAGAAVAHVAREVADDEGVLGGVLAPAERARLHEEVVPLVRVVDRLAKLAVRAVGLLAHLVEKAHDARRALLDEVDAPLVVLVLDRRPLDALLVVERLLRLEDEAEEELLELLVGKVDAELLEGVLEEGLEAVHVEEADEGAVLLQLPAQLLVDLRDAPVEELRVEVLCERVAREERLLWREVHADPLVARGLGEDHRAADEAPVEVRHAQQLRHRLHRLVARRRINLSVVLAAERNVAEVQQAGDDLEDAVLGVGVEADGLEGGEGAPEALHVVDPIRSVQTALVRVPELLGPLGKTERPGRLVAGECLVEDVVVALSLALVVDAAALEEVLLRRRPQHLALRTHRDLEELAEARRVVVARRLGVA